MAANRKSNFLICVGIGKKQKPLVKKAVDAGFEVIGVDKNPYSGCQSLCIHTIKCSTHEPIKVIKELKSYLQEVKPKGVIFFTDGKALLTVALISEEFSLGNLSLKLAKASVEKTVLYEDCKKLGILTPISIKLDSFKYFKEQYFGMVIKPDISTFGTKNVFRLTNRKNLKINFEMARSESLNKSVQIQEFINGLDLGVMSIIKNSKREYSVFFDQWFVLEKGKFNKVGFGIPSIIKNKEFLKQINSKIDILINYWNVTSGIISFSFKLDFEGNIWLYEVNPGIPGDHISRDLLPKAFPYSLNDIFEVNWNLMQGINFHYKLDNPFEFSIFERKLMPLEEALLKMQSSSKYQELILRIKKYCDNKKNFQSS